MFYRGNIQRRKLLKPRSHKKKKRLDQPDWDVSVFCALFGVKLLINST